MARQTAHSISTDLSTDKDSLTTLHEEWSLVGVALVLGTTQALDHRHLNHTRKQRNDTTGEALLYHTASNQGHTRGLERSN